jgi:alkylation response protein AidB-like acyl-CoA dehydrogenase
MSDDGSPALHTQSFEARLKVAVAALWLRAADHDRDGADPAALCAPLVEAGLFLDALPRQEGASGLTDDGPALARTLLAIGAADLSAGRIFEGHVNAVKLVLRYGGPDVRRGLIADVQAGAVGGVWNAEAPPGLRIDARPTADRPGRLEGGKIYASGLGFVTRPLITARTPLDEMLMLAPRLKTQPPCDLSSWTVRGMRATATGTVDFTGLVIAPDAVVGEPGDYYRSPFFKGGAWRFAAVQAGAAARLLWLMRQQLRERRREADPHQRARLGTAAMAMQTAELWVMQAAALAEDASAEPATVDAYVNLTRLAVERSALEVIALAERGLGLSAFTRPNPVERVMRDLSTYLRQPFPDGALDDAATYVGDRPGLPPWSPVQDLVG